MDGFSCHGDAYDWGVSVECIQVLIALDFTQQAHSVCAVFVHVPASGLLYPSPSFMAPVAQDWGQRFDLRNGKRSNTVIIIFGQLWRRRRPPPRRRRCHFCYDTAGAKWWAGGGGNSSHHGDQKSIHIILHRSRSGLSTECYGNTVHS